MKKSLFLLILLTITFPFAMHAQSVPKAVVVDSVTVCDSLVWVDDITYTTDTNVIYQSNGTTRVLLLHVQYSTRQVAPSAEFGCVYTWNGKTYTAAGTYTDTLNSAIGCDSIVTIELTKNGYHRDTLDAVTACNSYNWMERELTADGFYSDTVHSTLYDCDSITVLPLIISSTITHPADTVEVCGQYTWHGETYRNEGEYTITRTDTAANCDSVYTLVLSLTSLTDTMPEGTFCEKTTWVVGDSSMLITNSGLYHITTVDTMGCPTTTYRQVNIVALRSVYDTIDTVGCGTVNYRFDNDGTRIHKINVADSTIQKLFSDHSVGVCRDSLSVVHCHAMQNAYRTDTVDACDSYEWKDKIYTISTLDSTKYPKQAVNGCDSIQYTLIRITPSPVITNVGGDLQLAHAGDATIYASCDQNNVVFTWDVTAGDSYEGDTVTLYNLTASSDVLLTATNPMSGCYTEQWIVVLVGVGIESSDNTTLHIYPNPTTARIYIESDATIRDVAIYNTIGQCIIRKNMKGEKEIAVNDLANGTYTMQLMMQDGETITRKIVISK